MTLRVGFVGTGGIAQAHLANVKQSPLAEIVAVCDIDESRAKAAAQKFGGLAYTDAEKMFAQEHLDAVFLSVPPFAHGDLEEHAATRGIHMLVEKPLGLDMERVRAKARVIQETGIITATGYCLRYLDTVQAAREYLADKPVCLVQGYYLTSFVATPWWRFMAKSGGQLVEQTTHTVDLVRYLAGEVSAVQAFMNLCAATDIEGLDIYDVGSVNLQFTSGAVGHVETTFLQPDHRSGVELMGRDFRVHIDGTKLTIVEKGQTVIKTSSVDFYKAQDEAFLKAVQTGDRNLVLAPYEEALRTLEVTLAANRSAETGEIVRL
ncbi:MAG: Gfo/Idh/MocA family oxidoreductase [Alicyclobacillus sp.]|nr:Gfo/Idh/MocA family oxidoreductase [Alicyclobacillus sp.]